MNLTDAFSGGRPAGVPGRGSGQPRGGWAWLGILRLGRRLMAVIAECNEAQRRMTYRMLSYDGHLTEPDAPPETYAEFMLRTSGPLYREPSDRQRLAGRAVR